MSDNGQWQSPGGPVPPFAGYAPAPTGTPAAGQGNQGWTPPPKPGLIPLRPLDLGTILGAAFRVLRRNPKPTFGAALLIQGIAYFVIIVAVGLVTFFAFSRLDSSTE
ncbi:MAG: hypothetical protein JWO10_1024, partial [Microbacteriaceae bacterium]|nr:hypothetical protein [Microbacteriaceae bacterium]